MSQELQYVLAAVSRVPAELAALKIDDEVQHFQRNLADQRGSFFGYFHDFDDTVSAKNGET